MYAEREPTELLAKSLGVNLKYALGVFLSIVAFGGCAASAQEADPGAIKKLAFLKGSWNCAISGPKAPPGDVDHLTYEFSPDWTWMIERSNLRENGKVFWSMQVWGYDASRKQLAAYQFEPSGVYTKTVQGWVDGVFVSKRDDNGATVTLKPVSQNAFDWTIESADRSYVVTEECIR
jgi:hypothetical protein